MNELIKLMRSKNLEELKENLTYNVIGLIASIPIGIFFLSVIFQLIKDLVTRPSFDLELYNPYAYTIKYVNIIATVFGILAIILYLIRKHLDGIKFKQIFEHPAIVLFILLAIWSFITTCINGFTDYALNGTYYRNESISSFLRYYLIYFICGLITTKKQRNFLLHLLMYSSMILVLFDLLNYINILDEKFNTLWSSVFFNTNHYGYYLTLVCLVSMSYFLLEDHNLKYLLIFCFNLFVLIFNNTFGSYLGVIIGLLFAFLISFKITQLDKRRMLTILIIVILSTVSVRLINPASSGNLSLLISDVEDVAENDENAVNAGSGRWVLWTYTVEELNKHPINYLKGFGVEGLSDQMMNKTGNSRPHNEFIQQVEFFGLPALILYVSAILLIYLRANKYYKSLDLPTIVALITSFGYLFQSGLGNTMFYTSPFFFSILGMCYYKIYSI